MRRLGFIVGRDDFELIVSFFDPPLWNVLLVGLEAPLNLLKQRTHIER